MALIKCEKCGGIVSDHAEFCPQCGYAIKKKKPLKKWLFFVPLFLIAAIGIGVLLFYIFNPIDNDLVGTWESKEDILYTRLFWTFEANGKYQYYRYNSFEDTLVLLKEGKYSANGKTAILKRPDETGKKTILEVSYSINGDTLHFNEVECFRIENIDQIKAPENSFKNILHDLPKKILSPDNR